MSGMCKMPFAVRYCTVSEKISGGRRPPLQCKSRLEVVRGENMRNGKIATLPSDIRDALNLRMENGEQGEELLAWLNGLPQVKDRLKGGFPPALKLRRTGRIAPKMNRQVKPSQTRSNPVRRLRIADCGLRIADCGLLPRRSAWSSRVKPSQTQSGDCGLRIADCGLLPRRSAWSSRVKPSQTQSGDCGLRIADCPK